MDEAKIVDVVLRVRRSRRQEEAIQPERVPETPESACSDERFVWIYINTKVRDIYIYI